MWSLDCNNHTAGQMNNSLSGHDSALQGYTGPGTTWLMRCFLMNHAPGAGLIARPVVQLTFFLVTILLKPPYNDAYPNRSLIAYNCING